MKYKNERWTTAEENKLKCMAKSDAEFQEIVKVLRRSPMAIVLRTRALSGLERPDAKRRMSKNYDDPTKRKREVYINHGKDWSKFENEKMMSKFSNGETIYQIAEDLKRTPGAIISQIENICSQYGGMTSLFNYAKRFLKFKPINCIQ